MGLPGAGEGVDRARVVKAKVMACSTTPIASCCGMEARLERLRAEMASVDHRRVDSLRDKPIGSIR
jgi:chromosome condensin MukBEF ATPase and DNA-binding subunit MukB